MHIYVVTEEGPYIGMAITRFLLNRMVAIEDLTGSGEDAHLAHSHALDELCGVEDDGLSDSLEP